MELVQTATEKRVSTQRRMEFHHGPWARHKFDRLQIASIRMERSKIYPHRKHLTKGRSLSGKYKVIAS